MNEKSFLQKSWLPVALTGFLAVLPSGLGKNFDAHAQNVIPTAHNPQANKQSIETYSRKDAYLASSDQIMIHFGEGMQRVDILTKILNDQGYTSIALPGAEPNTAYMRIDKSKPIEITQDDIDTGSASGLAKSVYDTRIGKPNEDLLSLAR